MKKGFWLAPILACIFLSFSLGLFYEAFTAVPAGYINLTLPLGYSKPGLAGGAAVKVVVPALLHAGDYTLEPACKPSPITQVSVIFLSSLVDIF